MQNTTNVDYLLENFTINEIEHIQTKLNHDIERKKLDLKQLIGERYRDLMEAADTIQHMNVSVHHVLNSLQLLAEKQHSNAINGYKPNHYNHNNEQLIVLTNKYNAAIITKLIVNTPIDIWTSLENEDLLLSTYLYFYGKHLCNILRESIAINKVLSQYETAIDRFNAIIIDKCWSVIGKQLLMDDSNESLVAHSLCCLMHLQPFKSSDLFHILLEKCNHFISDCFSSSSSIKQILMSVINILFNTVKCIYLILFKKDPKTTLLFEKFTSFSYFKFNSHIFNDTNLDRKYFKDIIDYKIINNVYYDDVSHEEIKRGTIEWIVAIKNMLKPYLSELFETSSSAGNICGVLNEIYSTFEKTQKLIYWDEYCDELLSVYLPFWNEFLISFVISRFKSIIDENIDKTFDILKDNVNQLIISNKTLSVNDFEVIKFVWDDNESNSFGLISKTNGQNLIIEKFCVDFDNSIKHFFDDIRMIKSGNFKLIDETNLNEFEFHLSHSCMNMIKQIKEYLNNLMNNSEHNELITIFCAQFLRHLMLSCSHLELCFETKNKIDITWIEAKELLLYSSYNAYKNWFDIIILKLFKTTSSELCASLETFIDNLFLWDKILIKEELEDGNEVTSTIKVPLQISAVLHQNLYSLCCEANRIGCHTLPKTVIINILSSLTNELSRVYSIVCDTLTSSDYPTAMKQVFALQIYFDLLFIKQFLATSRDDRIKFDEMPKIQELIQKFETFIDPFDLHVFFPYMQTNIAKIGKTSNVLFGLLLPTDSNISQNSKIKHNNQQINEMHNILPLNSFQKFFPLLNLNNSIKYVKK